MRKRILICLAGILLLSPAAVAQAPASEPQGQNLTVPKAEQATREDIAALMEVLHSRRTTEAMFKMLREQMLSGMHASFLQEHPNASPALLKKLDATMDGVFKYLDVEESLAITVPIYQKYLSHDDAIALISFYSSPTGQRYLERMPALVKEAGEAGGNMMKVHLPEIQEDAKRKYADFEKYVTAHPEALGDSAGQK